MKIRISVLFVVTCLSFVETLAQHTDHRNFYPELDSLEQILATNPPEGIELAALYNSLSNGYRHEAKKRIDYARRSIAVAEPLDSWALAANSYMQIGLAHDGEMRYDSTLIYFNKALTAAERMRDFPKRFSGDVIDSRLAAIYGNMGNLYNIQDSLHLAVEYYLRALAIFEKQGLRESEANAYYNIGEMYLAMENYPQAEENYRRTADIARQIGDSMFVAYADGGLAIVEMEKKNYARALEHACAAHAYFFAHPEEKSFQVTALNTLAQIYLEGYDDVAQAEVYVRQAVGLMDTQEVWLIQQTDALSLLAKIHLRRGEWRDAERAALQALEVLGTNESELTQAVSLYETLIKTSAHLGDAARAAQYLDRLTALQSLWSNKHYQSAIRDMEVKYETEKKETQISTLESEKRLMILLGIAGGAVLLLALAAMFFIWRWTAQRKRLAEQQIVQLEQEKQLVATQAVLDGEVQERIRLARDLHDGLGGLLSAMRLSLEDLQKVQSLNANAQARFDKTTGILDESMREMRRVAHHLMPDALSRYGLKTALSDFCNTIPVAEFIYYGYEQRFDRKLEVVVYRIAHELVNNALKHSEATHILVQIVQEAHRIALTVQDNGRGFDMSAAKPGMGITNIRDRVASFGGELNVSSAPGKGTEIHVEWRNSVRR